MTAKPDKYCQLPKPAFYDPLSKPINIYSNPHIYEQVIEQDKKAKQVATNAEYTNKVVLTSRMLTKTYQIIQTRLQSTHHATKSIKKTHKFIALSITKIQLQANKISPEMHSKTELLLANQR